MSSHREAPEISQDPVADNTDTYAFVSPDRPDTVTIITNYVPLEGPPGGPNFFSFGDDVLYSIYVDNDGDGEADIEYRFKFSTKVRNAGHVPLQHRPDHRAEQRHLERAPVLLGDARRLREEGEEAEVEGARRRRCRARPATSGRARRRTTRSLASAAVRNLQSGETVFAGQRHEGFYVDLGSIFDLGDAAAAPEPPPDRHRSGDGGGRDREAQRPHDRDPGPDLEADPRRIAADRRDEQEGRDRRLGGGEPAQEQGLRPRQDENVRRRGRGSRSRASATRCSTRSSCRSGARTSGTGCRRRRTKRFQKYVEGPELAKLLPVLYPGVFPNLRRTDAQSEPTWWRFC